MPFGKIRPSFLGSVHKIMSLEFDYSHYVRAGVS